MITYLKYGVNIICFLFYIIKVFKRKTENIKKELIYLESKT